MKGPLAAAGGSWLAALTVPAALTALTALAASLVVLPASAQVPRSASAAMPTADALAWLTRIQAAARNSNFQGTLVYSTGGTLSSSRVWHFQTGEQTYERLEALDGRQQRIARHNDTVHTLWPQTKTAVIEKRELLAAWSTTPQALDPQALDHYGLRREGSARVAGRDAVVFLLEPRDALRYAQRLWADQATGLMLRSDVIGESAAGAAGVLESTAFSEVQIDVKPQPDLVLQLMRETQAYQIVRPRQQRTTLETEGWTWARPVAGFRLAGCMRRGMETAGDEEPVLQAVFTDGLTHVSVFVEPFKPQRHGAEMQARQGATTALMVRRDEHWITVVGNVPPATLTQFAAAFERLRP